MAKLKGLSQSAPVVPVASVAGVAATTNPVVVPVAAPAAVSPAPVVEVKEKKAKGSGLTPKVKDPLNAQVETLISNTVKELFSKSANITSAQVFDAVKDEAAKIKAEFGDKSHLGKKIRGILRNIFKCIRVKTEAGTEKIYSLPKA